MAWLWSSESGPQSSAGCTSSSSEAPAAPIESTATTTHGTCPVKHKRETGGCPVQHQSTGPSPLNPVNFIPHGLSQQPSEGQEAPLETQREISTIPKGQQEDVVVDGDSHWVYPSEQQFYNALKRKGYETDATDVPMIVSIHNGMNEQCWQQIVRTERHLGGGMCTPRLVRFQGRPDELTPKARIYHWLGWAPLPFDRHDWVVDRCGKQVRYVIDFYHGPDEPGRAVFHVDARPAVDSVASLMDRMRIWWRQST